MSSNSRETVTDDPSSLRSRSTQSQSDVNYCINVINFLVASLGVRNVPVIDSIDMITVEMLVKLHCTLLDMNFSQEFIPSTNPVEGARRIILSLKDKYGAEKFAALDATRIAEKHPLDLKFLLENYHLIYAYKKKKLERSSSQSLPGSHLSIDDTSNMQRTYASTDGSQLNESTLDSNGSNTVIENFRVNIKDLTDDDRNTSSSMSVNETDTTNSTKENEDSSKPQTARGKVNGPTMTSSPRPQMKVQPPSGKVASNISSINNISTSDIRRTFETQKSVQTKDPEKVKNNVLHSQQRNKLLTDVKTVPPNTKTTVLYAKDSSEFMNLLSESIKAMDSDIESLKSKPSKPVKKTKTDYDFKSAPNVRDILPVDLRFPYYGKGVIIPKCKPVNGNKSTVSKKTLNSKSSVKQSESSCDSSESDLSTRATRNSLINDTMGE